MVRIISGGQTGADRAGLDAALDSGFPIGGHLVSGRMAEDGPLDPVRYKGMTELKTTNYLTRTKKNAEWARITLIFSNGPLSGGSKRTKEYAHSSEREAFHIDFDKDTSKVTEIITRRINNDPRKESMIINIAGSRGSKNPGLYQLTYDYLMNLFQTIK